MTSCRYKLGIVSFGLVPNLPNERCLNSKKAVQKDVLILIKFIHKVVNTLNWSEKISNPNGVLNVKKGWVTLNGELSCPFQREATKLLVSNLANIEEFYRVVIQYAKKSSLSSPINQWNRCFYVRGLFTNRVAELA